MEENEVNLESLERSVNALEHFLEKLESELTNAIDRFESVKGMTRVLIKQRDDAEKTNK